MALLLERSQLGWKEPLAIICTKKNCDVRRIPRLPKMTAKALKLYAARLR
jgi:hypothetical protein